MRHGAPGALLAASLLLIATATTASASVLAKNTPCAQPNGRVTTLAISNGTVYIGGSFTHVKDRSGALRPRLRLAAIDTTTCEVLPWIADADDSVNAIAVVGGTVYVGGSFRNVGGLSRNRIAAVDGVSAKVLPFSPNIDRPVNTLVASGERLYAGGSFNQVDGLPRAKLAAFTLSSGSLNDTWRPSANGAVSTLALGADGHLVYVGGAFTALNGQGKFPYLGAVDASDGGSDMAFVPDAAFPILNLVADSRGLYAGGGGSGGHLVIWNLNGTLQRPIYQTDGGVQTVTVDGNSLYAGGHFTDYCLGNTGSGHPFLCDTNVVRRKLFEVSLSTGALTSWAPSLNSPRGVFTSSVDPGTHALWVGGDFTSVNNSPVAHLATFPASP